MMQNVASIEASWWFKRVKYLTATGSNDNINHNHFVVPIGTRNVKVYVINLQITLMCHSVANIFYWCV